MKQFKIKLEREFIEGLAEVVQRSIFNLNDNMHCTDDDRLLASGLVEVLELCGKKLLKIREDYACTFTPTQAIAIRIMYTQMLADSSVNYMQNQLRIISDAVHKHYL